MSCSFAALLTLGTSGTIQMVTSRPEAAAPARPAVFSGMPTAPQSPGSPTSEAGCDRQAGLRLTTASPQPLREELGEPADRTVLQGLHGSLVAVHDLGGLRDGQALQEAQRDALLLVGVELAHAAQQLLVRGQVEHLLLGAVRARGELDDVRRRRLQPVAAGLDVVEDQVAGDG